MEIVKQAFGKVWKEVLARNVDFLPFLVVVESIDMVSSSRKTMKSVSWDCSAGRVRRASWGYPGGEGAENFRNQAKHAHSMACLYIRAARAAEYRGRVGLARVKGRQGQEEKGEHLMAMIPGSCHAFSDGLDKLNCFLGTLWRRQI